MYCFCSGSILPNFEGNIPTFGGTAPIFGDIAPNLEEEIENVP